MKRFQFKACDLMYVGDSITDVQPLRYALEDEMRQKQKLGYMDKPI